MRYINRGSISVPANWLALATQAKKNPRWSYFKAALEGIVEKKCWYSESDNAGAKNPIDHFRPKAATVARLTPKNADLGVAVWNSIDAATRTGYPFLEFEFDNYRYSCDFTNSLNSGTNGKAKGKSNFFPLRAGSRFATSPANLNIEHICLLDPCDPADPKLLAFTNTGYVQPHISVLSGTWEYSKVMVSIEVYHLHYNRFIEKRVILWNDCKEHIELADILFKKTDKTNEDNTNIAYHIKHLTQKISKKSEFSATAIDCLTSFLAISTYSWLKYYFPSSVLIK